MSEAQLRALSDPTGWAAVFGPAEIAALDLATRLCHDAHDLGAELTARLRAHYDERQLAEIILVAGQANMNNRAGEAAKQLLAAH